MNPPRKHFSLNRAASKCNCLSASFFSAKFILCLLLLRFGLLNNSAPAATFSVSPSSISNTYTGMITLQVAGLTNGEMVVVQKFLDANANGVIDAADSLVQQFNLKDGTNSVIGGVTNINVPGDLNSTTGAITATLNFKNGDFVQNIIGQYAFKLSSPVGHFAPLTNLFNVTNFAYAQQFTGNVVNNGTNVPNAIVILFGPPRPGHGPGNPQAAALANNSGAYAIKVPPGTYTPVAFKSNFVTSFISPRVLTLGGGATINTNLTFLAATQSISGRFVDAANSSIGLPGIFVVAQANGLIGIAFTDTNGNFTVKVNAGLWKINAESASLLVHGYVGTQDGTNVSAGSTGITIPVSKATAMFYGSVKDNLGNPLVGIDVYASDNNQYSADGYTDVNGNYVTAVLGSGTWQVNVDSGGGSGNPTNYVFSQSPLNQNGGTNLAAGQALLQNFTAILATNHITGKVQFGGTNLAGVQISAYANLGGLDYQTQADTDADGNYSLNVANGNWSVSVNCYNGDSSLDGLLGSGNYQCPNNQNVNIASGNGTANFSVQSCQGVQITTPDLPDGEVGIYYDQFLNAASCNNSFTWSLNSGALPPGLQLDSGGKIYGTPASSGTFTFNVQVTNQQGSTNKNLSITILSAVQITTTSLPPGVVSQNIHTNLQATGGQPPYDWNLISGSLPPGVNFDTGLIDGIPTSSGTFNFTVQVIDQLGSTDNQSLTLTINGSSPLQVMTPSLPSGMLNTFYSQRIDASGGQPPYYWSLSPGSNPLPPRLFLASDGTLNGTPDTNGTFIFSARVMDSVNTTADRDLSLTISLPPRIGLVTQLTGNQLQFQISGPASHLYDIQTSTNLQDWLTVKIYAPTASVFSVVINIASNEPHRFYRAVLGAAFTDSITQLIRAADGGTIILPSGATVTIPPGFLTNDMDVTVFQLSTLPGESPDGALSSVGPVLFLTFQDAPGALPSLAPKQHKNSVSSSTIDVLINVPVDVASRLDGAVAAVGEVGSAFGDCFLFSSALAATAVSETSRRIQIPAQAFALLHNNGVLGVFTFTVGLINSAGTPTQFFPPKRLLWTGNGWTENFNTFDPDKRTLLLVHGLISCVESAYNGSVENILREGCYQQAVGFDYNWAQSINVSGQQLAAFLNDLHGRGATNIDIEAHSEGVPVAISAAVRALNVPIANMVFLGGAILGSPIANQPSHLLSALWYLGQLERHAGVDCSPYPRLDDALNGPLGPDLSANSSTLQLNRDAFLNERSQTRVVLVAGDRSLLPDCVSARLFSGLVNDGIIPKLSALALPTPWSITLQLNHIQLISDSTAQLYVGAAVRGTIPVIALSTRSLAFSNACSDAELTVSNVGPRCSQLHYVINNNLPWLVVNPLSSTLDSGDSATHSISVDARHLSPGLNTGTITISDPAATNSPQIVTFIIAARPYTITDLGTLGGGSSHASDINNSGHVVGHSTTSSLKTHAFLWRNGMMTDLGTLAGGTASAAYSINSSGHIVGQSRTTATLGGNMAFLYMDGAMIGLTLESIDPFGWGLSAANGINDSIQIVGGIFSVGFMETPNVQTNQLVRLLGGDYAVANSINNSSHIVGWSQTSEQDSHATIWQNGAITDLGTLGGFCSEATCINDLGQIVGWSETPTPGERHAFLWANGVMIDLGPGEARGINNLGQVVGRSDEGACLWQNGTRVNLNNLICPESLERAEAINDSGQIVGGNFLLTPNQ